jgi:hypothetical protein
MSVPVFITYRDRRTMLDQTLASLARCGFDDITVIDNDSETPLPEGYRGTHVVYADNRHRQLAPWLLDLVPDDSYYVVMDCDNELVCPTDVEEVLIDALERYPEIEKIGLGIKTDDLLFPPPEHYSYSYLMEYSVERGTRYKTIGWALGERVASIIDAPIDTTFAMHRPGHGWPGIVGARTTAPYHIKHLSWYNAEYTAEEKLYYARAGNAWTMGHSAGSLLDTTVAVPFTSLRAETVVALTGEQVRYSPMLDDGSYFELLRDLWVDGRSFIIVEHDIVVNETTLDELRVCDHDWCAMPFPYRGNPMAYSLACAKFSAALIARNPDLMEIVGQRSDAKHPPRHWCRMDAWIWQLLTDRGEVRHEHSRSQPVGHVGPQFPSHGCLVE